MKRVLITGVNSYIGNAVEDYLKVCNSEVGQEEYCITKLSLRDATWKEKDFSEYNVLLNVAGMAHADVGHVSEEVKAAYYRVNAELAEEVAGKAKKDGVRQFIHLSSVIVYGDSAGVGGKKMITGETVPEPANFYGDSKRRAEEKLLALTGQENWNCKIAILRLPMIYGKNSKGNYPMLEKIAEKIPVFPAVDNQRSMLYIENLCEFIRELIDKEDEGIFYPQNPEYTTTSEMVREIGAIKGKKIFLWKILNPLVFIASKMPGKVGNLCNKAFGSLTLDMKLSNPEGYSYQKYNLRESLRRMYEN